MPIHERLLFPVFAFCVLVVFVLVFTFCSSDPDDRICILAPLESTAVLFAFVFPRSLTILAEPAKPACAEKVNAPEGTISTSNCAPLESVYESTRLLEPTESTFQSSDCFKLPVCKLSCLDTKISLKREQPPARSSIIITGRRQATLLIMLPPIWLSGKWN